MAEKTRAVRRLGPPDQQALRGGPHSRQQAPACERRLSCPGCHKPMKLIAVITDPAQLIKILRHLIKTDKLSGDSRSQTCESPPPGLDPASLN
jgi:hypothetical protein